VFSIFERFYLIKIRVESRSIGESVSGYGVFIFVFWLGIIVKKSLGNGSGRTSK